MEFQTTRYGFALKIERGEEIFATLACRADILAYPGVRKEKAPVRGLLGLAGVSRGRLLGLGLGRGLGCGRLLPLGQRLQVGLENLRLLAGIPSSAARGRERGIV